jgi:hypothetical protein
MHLFEVISGNFCHPEPKAKGLGFLEMLRRRRRLRMTNEQGINWLAGNIVVGNLKICL